MTTPARIIARSRISPVDADAQAPYGVLTTDGGTTMPEAKQKKNLRNAPSIDPVQPQDSPLLRLRAGLKRHFGRGVAGFVDPVLWMGGWVCLDFIRLEKWFTERNLCRDGESIRSAVRRKYGRDAECFLMRWIDGERRPSVQRPLAAPPSARRPTKARRSPKAGKRDRIDP